MYIDLIDRLILVFYINWVKYWCTWLSPDSIKAQWKMSLIIGYMYSKTSQIPLNKQFFLNYWKFSNAFLFFIRNQYIKE